MTTYPLPTLGPTITSAGITVPAYADILLSLQTSYQSIYGTDAILTSDSQDGQWLAVLAAAINDSNQQIIAVYNQFNPAFAQGTGLSSLVKINGIKRLVPSNSSAIVTIGGVAGTTIDTGIIGDNIGAGTQWVLPISVTIPGGGTIDVTAICLTPGAVQAAVGTLTKILTPTAGWQTTTNASNASPGAPLEDDATLRQRQAASTALPSLTVVDGIVGAVKNLPGVTAVLAHENKTRITDGSGVPGNTLAMVVQGGDAQSIANIIGIKLSPGCDTFGTTTETYVSPQGIPAAISFSVPTIERILVAIQLHALTNYTSSIGNEIKAAIAAYINSLGIGTNILLSRLYAPALLQGPFGAAAAASPTDATTYEITSLLIAISPASPGSADIPIVYNQIANCLVADISIAIV